MAVDTSKVTDRRALSFATLADVVVDAERIAASDRAGTLRRTGNWTAAQILNHVSSFMEFPFDGYPPELASPPWFVKLIMKFMKGKYLKGLPAGVSIPRIPGGTVGAVDGPIDLALARFKKAAQRMEKTPPAIPNPIFGPITHQEWVQLQCLHAQLHFSFLHP